MIDQVREWLPPTAVIDTALDSRVAAAVARWSARWFAVTAFTLGSAKWLPNANELAASAAAARGVDLRIEDERLDSLARLLLDIPEDLPIDGAARQVVHAVATKAMQQLVADLAADLELPLQAQPSTDEAILSFPLRRSDGGAPVAQVTLRWANLVRSRKARIGSPRLGALAKVADALAGAEVPFDAVLGSVSLSVLEFQALGVGDVLLFDADPTDDVELRLKASGRPLGRARLEAGSDRLSLLAA